MTFEEASQLPRSEKVSLAIIESAKQLRVFTLHSGSIYYRDVDFKVVKIKQGQSTLTEVNSLGSVIAGTWYYDYAQKRVYLRTIDSSDPKTKEMIFTYKHFFSNAPLILPEDLNEGNPVEFLPYIEAISSIGQQLDDENTGIVLESNSSITLINNHGYFDEIFDTHIFENKTVDFYNWFPSTHISQARKIFSGVIESKDYEPDKITFKVKDFVFRLRDFVNLPLFSELDGRLSPSLIGTPKRRIYGQAKQVKLAPIDNILNGYFISGTGVINIESNILTGTGTFFLDDLSPGDEIKFTVAGKEYKYGIEQVNSDTEAIINKESEINIINQSILVSPTVPSRQYNRIWNVAGHKLREPFTQITNVIANNRFVVQSTQDIFAGDQLLIAGDLVTVRRISGNEIITQSAVSPIPSIGDEFLKLPIQNVFYGKNELIYGRDWNYVNGSDCIVNIGSLAEFNITQELLLGVNLTFTAGSRSLTTTAVSDFRSILKPRDFIRKNSLFSGENDWYEILEVKEQEIILRDAYTGTTATTTALYKAIDFISDDSLITANCLGYEDDTGLWLKTPSDAVRHLVLNDAEFPGVNEASFAKAKADCEYILSIIIPESLQSQPPTVKDVITKINESCFGSLYGNQSLDISYSILNSEKPDLSEIVRDDDIISFSTESSTEIYNAVQLMYRPFVDIFSGEDTFETLSHNSGFVDKYVGIKNRLEKTVYLYEQDKVQIIAERYALFKSLTNTKVSIKGKMNFFLKSVNDKIFLSLDRLYKRFGGEDRRKIGIITGIKKSQAEVDLTISDLGNIFNRVPAIAPNTASDFSTAINDEKVKWGYIVDNSTETPNPASELFSNCNIIG